MFKNKGSIKYWSI